MSQPSEPEDPSKPATASLGEVAPGPPHDLDAPAVPFIGRRGHRRIGVESIFIRFVATGGVIGIGVAAAAIMGTQDIAVWVIGLVVSVLSVVLAAILWSSRTL
jgi:hypothetical protein